jgi:hypothetical protein
MRNRTPPVWLAIAAAVLLVAFSVGSALGADPADDKENHGQQVSDFVHSLLFGDGPSDDEDESTDEETTDEETTEESETEDEETTDEESADGPPDNHGQCVRVVAMGTDTGGPQDNHGGAVNEAARVTCWESSEDGDGSESGDDEGQEVPQRGNSANAHEKNEARKGGGSGGDSPGG